MFAARRLRALLDPFTLILIGVVLLATLLPAQGRAEEGFRWLTHAAIALLFFMHGAKLSRQQVIAGMTHWRLHLVIFACTFVLFPLLGLLLKPLAEPLVGPSLYMGILYMCALPATVQSAIAFTSLARGNIPAAICSAAASSLIGIFLTPLLVLWLLGAGGDQVAGGGTLEAIRKIVVQLLIPFVAGQIARRWIGDWVARNRHWLKNVDQTSIVLVVYTAFSQAVNQGLWAQVPAVNLVALLVLCCVMLAIVLALVWFVAKALGFDLADRITILFGGSKKSLATGVPMAQVLFSASSMGAMLLPIMIFHQIQLMVCAVLAQRFSQRPEDE
ncbi:bile acid:sodium symporter [Allofranklinella schreckenbergeri]|uniref:Bile acid:sodium symporter n=1 Tax=Allofranklinella schreckenbergeri TaxID=1076744 RepID=A0A3M6QAS0_9BURK|nr:bile acid:sodium symporter family protein [Allofranklinella schreckenbergeri]RMW95432.1 bile acid:sodium symporter [Allofranklinella schreckenbergeri]RMX00150.1 bile acid:sodium symporter [Allofranklinella schreckenbergeri]RMX08989.1 bile acid:sodium symporter [Allofranklinella schreckenbergeri]RRD42813.1 bile acid:sodium symporter [Comamonadaceae bacterium OH3737_COT-264]